MNKNIIFGIILFSIFLNIAGIMAIGPVGENGINVRVENNSIQLQGYTIIRDPNTGVLSKALLEGSFISKTTDSLGAALICSNFNYTEGNQSILIPTNCTYNVNYLIDIPFLNQNITNNSQQYFVDSTTQSKYEQCIVDKSQYINSYNNCLGREKLLGDYSTNYTSCSSLLINCQNSLSKSEEDIKILKKEKEDAKNTPWLYGFIGILIGAGAMYWYRNNNSKVRNPDSNYNRTQSG
jgi:hypothetical protein